MAWVYLLGAGLLEVVWAFAMKQSAGFTRPGPTAVMVVAMVGSVILLTLSMRHLPLGTAYAIWTGIGTLGAFVLGIALLGEAATPMRIAAATLILAGLVLMKVSSDG
ncbi:MAG: multidrug efflux SMR transporter [Rhodobacteraceae bacterium]|jgi:quaternary ammonium compound-resistance protein SugE|nr:multidrug efflux SMR transporter [Paracoccaceae bacterium]